MKNLVITLLMSITIISLAFRLKTTNENLESTRARLEQVEKELEEKNLIKPVNTDSLTEWNKFTLALMKVESNFDPTAVSSAGAKGYFQITPIYVAEVNRVHKTNYIYEEVVSSFEQSYEVFTLMQEAYNSEYNMDEALRLHNGDHKWYKKRVYKEMDAIERYEEMRQMVKSVDVI